MSAIDSYDKDAPVPSIGSIWVWELDKPHARALIEVVETKWNGEEWWVRTKLLLPTYYRSPEEVVWNDLSRFWEAVTAVRLSVAP